MKVLFCVNLGLPWLTAALRMQWWSQDLGTRKMVIYVKAGEAGETSVEALKVSDVQIDPMTGV